MSHRSQIKQYIEERKKARETLTVSIRLSVFVLAAALLFMTVLFTVDALRSDKPDKSGEDTTPPVIKGPEGGIVYLSVDGGVSFYSAVNVTDDSEDEVKLSVDDSQFVRATAGSYPVTYTATDSSGNVSRLTLTFVVTESDYSYDKLMTEVGKKAAALGLSTSMSKEELVKGIFKYVNSPGRSAQNANIVWAEHSNIKNIDRSAWQSDWIKEAYLSLMNGQGDCYSYYSVSKAFFEYFDIENKGVKQKETADGSTHFWSMVNIGSASNPRWYFYDSTRLKNSFRVGSGCLFTEAQRDDYNTVVVSGFYNFDKAGYPNTETKVINADYSWN